MGVEEIKAAGDVVIGAIAAVGAVVSTVVGFFTWKTRYELDKLYAAKYRPNPDGTPGPMRRHPRAMVKLFKRKVKSPPDETPPTEETR